jgi:small GTP-binding protein
MIPYSARASNRGIGVHYTFKNRRQSRFCARPLREIKGRLKGSTLEREASRVYNLQSPVVGGFMKNPMLKLLMLGEVGVGKTSLSRRLVFNTFDSSYKATIGVDIFDYTLRADLTGLAVDVNLLIWDIDGEYSQDVFRHIYSEGASAALIVSDVSRPLTQKAAVDLWTGFDREFPGRPSAIAMNKVDLIASPEDVLAPASIGVDFVWTSAKTGYLVADAFAKIARECIARGLAL